jgi:hypothetical protein
MFKDHIVETGAWVKIRLLRPHPTIQRLQFNLKHAKDILASFNPDALGTLKVIKDGSAYLVIDGQHRLWAAREFLGDDSQCLRCDVYKGLSEEQASSMWLELNDALAVRTLDKFDKAVKAGKPEFMVMDSILRKHGLSVSPSRGEGRFQAVKALEKVYTAHGEQVTDRAITLLQMAYGTDPDGVSGALVSGMGLLVARFNGDLIDGQMADKLGKAGRAGQILGLARDGAKAKHVSIVRAMADEMLHIYNKGRRTNVLSLEPSRLMKR